MDAQTSLQSEAAVEATMETWELDASRSSLTFKLRHIVVQEIRGRFARWGGRLLINRSKPSRFGVEIWVDLASIETGEFERDAHMRSSEFLHVTRYPRAEFRSTDVWLEDEQMIIKGRLDLHGVVRDVELRATVGPVTTGSDGRQRRRCTARGTLDRQSFGLHWNQDLETGGVVVGDEVAIGGEVELVRRRSACAGK